MGKTVKFIKNAGIYFFGNVLTKILAFFLIPLYTNLIEASSYGYYDLVVSILTLVIPIIFFQIWDGMFRFIYDYKDISKKYMVITNGFIISFFSIVIYIVGMTILSQFVIIQNPILVFLYGLTLAFQYIYGTIARTFEKNKLYALSGVINTFTNLILNVFLILVFDMGIKALYISVIIGNILQIIIIEVIIKPLKEFRYQSISKDMIRKMIKFSMPIAISTISFWLLTGYSKVLISSKMGMTENGVFAIAMKFASVLTMIVSVLQMSWHELSFSLVNDKNKREYYSKGINIFFKAMLSGTILIIPITKIIFPYFVANEYYNAIYIMPIIYLYTAINSFSGFISTQFLAEKDSKTTLYSCIAAAIANIILSNLLITPYGLAGVTASLLISFTINMMIRVLLMKKKFNIEIEKRYVISFIILIVIYILGYYYDRITANVLLFMVGIVITFFYFKKEVRFLLYNILNIFKKRLEK